MSVLLQKSSQSQRIMNPTGRIPGGRCPLVDDQQNVDQRLFVIVLWDSRQHSLQQVDKDSSSYLSLFFFHQKKFHLNLSNWFLHTFKSHYILLLTVSVNLQGFRFQLVFGKSCKQTKKRHFTVEGLNLKLELPCHHAFFCSWIVYLWLREEKLNPTSWRFFSVFAKEKYKCGFLQGSQLFELSHNWIIAIIFLKHWKKQLKA